METIKQESRTLWDATKAFFKHSTTILVARVTALTGLTTASMALMNWSPLLSLNIDTGINKTQALWLGGLTFVQGVVTELARRRTLVSTSS